MSTFNFRRGPDLKRGLQEFRETPGSVLLDVRGEDEYRSGHLPGSKNLPRPMLPSLSTRLGPKSTPVFLYCLSGSRSARAARFLQRRGYARAKSIGGISGYTGPVER